MKIISELAKKGVQIFITTHSYFVLKQLHIEARSNAMDIMCCSLNRNDRGTINTFFGNLRESLPDNSIINESMTMYDEDIDLDMGDSNGFILGIAPDLPWKVELRLIFSNR